MSGICNHYKCIFSMISVRKGDISDKLLLKQDKIDAVVNAANPTLMGSNQGVDGAIHRSVDRFLTGQPIKFNEQIRKELDGENERPDNTIRCQRGKAVLTQGYGLCKYIIHVVGPIFDGKSREDTKRNYRSCSSSRIRILEDCYYSIIEVLKEHADIHRIAIPIISSGEYGFPFKLAVRIAVAATGNALIEWQKKDPEMFELSGIQKVKFYVYKAEKETEQEYEEKLQYINYILSVYRKNFSQQKKVVYQTAVEANIQVLQEIRRYDHLRGYFSIASSFRKIITWLRIFCVFWTGLKDKIGGIDWQRRRSVVEVLAFVKILIPVFFCIVLNAFEYPAWMTWILQVLVIYSLLDTVTYLLSLILMSDIQRPSANLIRSLILLLVNYLEVCADMGFLYFVNFRDTNITYLEALRFGILNSEMNIEKNLLKEEIFVYGNTAIKFFFITLAFGYFAGHIKQRKFRS